MVHGHCKFIGLRLTPQSHLYPITPSYLNPNLTKHGCTDCEPHNVSWACMEWTHRRRQNYIPPTLSGDNNSWIKFDTVSLDVNSKIQIEGGEMLDDRTIEACQTILNSQFPGINGFQATVLGQGDIFFMPIVKDML